MIVTPNNDTIFQAVREFLAQVLTAGTEIIQAQINRAPEPPGTDFVVMTLIGTERLATNVATYEDCAIQGLISGNTLQVNSIELGILQIGAQLFGSGVAPSMITAFGSGTGGVGSYMLDTPQNVAPQAMAAGVSKIMQANNLLIQLDVHGPASHDNALIISTLFRDAYAVDFFDALALDIAPLYADDPKQIPFINAEQQYENRWVVQMQIQVNQAILVPQQFAESVSVGLIEVDTTYPT